MILSVKHFALHGVLMAEDKTKICLLFDFYGELLSESQFSSVDLYYNDDLSLSEISEVIGISRQGVRDNIVRAVDLLCFYESKLRLAEKYKNNKDVADRLSGRLSASSLPQKEKDELLSVIGSLSF